MGVGARAMSSETALDKLIRKSYMVGTEEYEGYALYRWLHANQIRLELHRSQLLSLPRVPWACEFFGPTVRIMGDRPNRYLTILNKEHFFQFRGCSYGL